MVDDAGDDTGDDITNDVAGVPPGAGDAPSRRSAQHCFTSAGRSWTPPQYTQEIGTAPTLPRGCGSRPQELPARSDAESGLLAQPHAVLELGTVCEPGLKRRAERADSYDGDPMIRVGRDPAGGPRRPTRTLRALVAVALVVATALVAAATPTPAEADASEPWTLPEMPPRCTSDQAASGDVGDCLLAFYQDPAETGWGTPPDPGVGPGWDWQGYTYNGSPALADWEATHIVANSAPVAEKAPGYLESHLDAQVLFEGFLNEISAGGYRVHAVTGYSFRCTGGGGWSCPSGDPADLSYHAWGLAIDMNAGTNPIRSYSGVDGQTACLTPMQTDMPRWVIQAAEKWGLYWGGYGWSNGCQTTSTQRSIVYRDPPHFEFRGTPEHAAAIAAFNLRNDPSAVCFDVVDDDGSVVERCTIDGVPRAGWRLPVHLDAPDDAVAALVNLTGTAAPTAGSFTIEDCGPRPHGERGTTSLQFSPGSAIATMAVAPLSVDDTFCVWRSASAHSIVDVIGYLTATGERVWVDPVDPTRITDTRAHATCTPDQVCREGPIEHEGIRRIPTSDTSPRLANITTTRSDGRGWLQAGRCDDVGPGRMFSNLNYVEIGARANLVLVEGGASGTCTHVFTGTHVIVDELARLDAESGFGWDVSAARRVYDSGARLTGGSVTEVDLGIDAPAAAVAISVSETDVRGYATVAPCAEFEPVVATGDEPETSSVNHVAGQRATNLALTEVDGGRVCVYTFGDARVTLDLQAELVDDHTIGLHPVTPLRTHDTRG